MNFLCKAVNRLFLVCFFPLASLVSFGQKQKGYDAIYSVSVLDENWWWVEKSGRRSGSKGYSVSLDKIVIIE